MQSLADGWTNFAACARAMAARFSRPRFRRPSAAEVPTTSRWTDHGHAAASLVDQPPRVLWVLVIGVVLPGRALPRPKGAFSVASPSGVRGLFCRQLSELMDAL
jgi:hypothetical protein